MGTRPAIQAVGAVLATSVRGAGSAVVAVAIRAPAWGSDALVGALPHRAAQLKEEQHNESLFPQQASTHGARQNTKAALKSFVNLIGGTPSEPSRSR